MNLHLSSIENISIKYFLFSLYSNFSIALWKCGHEIYFHDRKVIFYVRRFESLIEYSYSRTNIFMLPKIGASLII